MADLFELKLWVRLRRSDSPWLIMHHTSLYKVHMTCLTPAGCGDSRRRMFEPACEFATLKSLLSFV